MSKTNEIMDNTKTQNLYILRHKPGNIDVIDDMKTDGLICIGWTDIATNQYNNENLKREDLLNDIDKNTSYSNKGYIASQLEHFLINMKAGDLVVVPANCGKFYIAEILDPKPSISKNNKAGDIYVRQVKYFNNGNPYERKNAPHTLQSKMKMRQTCIRVCDAPILLDTKTFIDNEGNYSGSIIIQNKIKDILKAGKTNLSPRRFEELIYKILITMGCDEDTTQVNSTQNSKDGDIDVQGYHPVLNRYFYIQAKLHEGETSEYGVGQLEQAHKEIEEMDQLSSEEGYTLASEKWVISTCENFAEEAVKKATEYKIRLINVDVLSSILVQLGILDF